MHTRGHFTKSRLPMLLPALGSVPRETPSSQPSRTRLNKNAKLTAHVCCQNEVSFVRSWSATVSRLVEYVIRTRSNYNQSPSHQNNSRRSTESNMVPQSSGRALRLNAHPRIANRSAIEANRVRCSNQIELC